ncbi:MAG: acyltransferase [Anaeromyxobacteraceae bacterium]
MLSPATEATALPGGEARFRALTGLRFLAAAHVVWFHAGPATGVPALDRVRGAGWTAVNLFFVLSGFVLAHRYPRLEGPGAVRGFLAARAARIYPAHLLALAGTLVALGATGALAAWAPGWTGRPLGLALEALLLHAWVPPTGGVNLPDWTLSVELGFYALFPLLLPRLGRRPPGAPAGFAAACVLAYAAAFAVAYAFATGAGPLPASNAAFGWWNNLPPTRLPAFVLGMALARYAGEPGGARLLARHGTALALAGAAGAVLVMAVVDLPWPALEVTGTLLLPFHALLVLGLAGGRGPLAAALSNGAAGHLGDWSYGVYLYQWPVLVVFRAVAAQPAGRLGAGAFLAYLAVLVAVSGLVFRGFEDPARRALRRALA